MIIHRLQLLCCTGTTLNKLLFIYIYTYNDFITDTHQEE